MLEVFFNFVFVTSRCVSIYIILTNHLIGVVGGACLASMVALSICASVKVESEVVSRLLHVLGLEVLAETVE